MAPAPDHIGLRAVHLDVTELDRSLMFWRDLVGLVVAGEQEGGAVALGAGGDPLVVLHPGAVRAAGRGHSGLYHLAIHIPTRAGFARALARIGEAGWPQAPTDHIIHWATYLSDPDGIGLELSHETLDRFGHYELGGGRPIVVGTDGRRTSAVEPLDLQGVFSNLSDGAIDGPLPDGSWIGHIHLHVGDLDEAIGFYSDVVGYTRGMVAPQWGMADFSAGGSFPHRFAVNVWQGPRAPQAPAGSAGLRRFELRYDDAAGRSGALARLAAAGARAGGGDDGLWHDPSGNRFMLV